MDASKISPSISETLGEMPANTAISQPAYEQSDTVSPVPVSRNGPALPTTIDGQVHLPASPMQGIHTRPTPPPYGKENNDKQATAVIPNNPYPGYDISRMRTPVTPLECLGEVPAHINCPFCNTISLTTVQKTDSSQTTYARHVYPFSSILYTD